MRMLLAGAAAGLLASAAWADEAPSAPGGSLTGFTPAGAASERSLEARFDSALSPAEIQARLKLMSSAPNHVGSPHDRWNAEYTLAQYKSWGWDAHIETFDVLYPTPIS
jgi:N-acetylated-alpha-linked acidic dipeptidase